MIQLLKIRVSGYKMLKNNFEVNFMPEARVYIDEGGANNEVFEVDRNLYANKMIAFTGRNASGKSTTLKFIAKVTSFMNSGRWYFEKNDFNKNSIELKIDFYKDGSIYIYKATIVPQTNDDSNFIRNPFCEIKNEILEFAKYRPQASKHYEKRLTFSEVSCPITGLNDTSKIVFVTGNQMYGYNMGLFSNGTVVSNQFFENLNYLNFSLTCNIIKLLDESVEYIKYDKTEQIKFKRFGTKEQKLTKTELLNVLSNGTIKGIDLYINVIKLLKTGGMLFVDEIENCFHKNLVNNIFYLLEDPRLNRHNSMILFTTHYVEILDDLNRRDSIYILHKNNNNISINNLYKDYDVRTEILKSKQFNNNTFDTLLNYETLMDVKRGILDEISDNN